MLSRIVIFFTLVLLSWNSTIGFVQSQIVKPQTIVPPTGSQEFANVRVVRDIEYARTPEKKLLLDLYLPQLTSTRPFPAVVWIHGGGWRGGSKAKPLALPLNKHGYVVASINYRLSTQAKFPAQIYDCKAAIRWLRANADKYHLDPNHIGAWGASAGGHLAAMLGTSWAVRDLEGNLGNDGYSSRIHAVVDFYGPTDFLRMDAAGSKITHNAPDSPESGLIGGPIQKNKAKVASANPISYISEDSPPFLIVHGDKDRIVPYEQSQLLHTALIQSGVESTLYRLKGAGHGGRSQFGSERVLEIVRNFFDQHLKGITKKKERKDLHMEQTLVIDRPLRE